MGIFEYKFNKNVLRLRLEFNYDTNQYVYYYGDTEIPYDRLSFGTKLALNKENKKLEKNPEILKGLMERKKIMDRFDYFKELGLDPHSFQTLGGTGGTMSDEMQTFLNDLVSQENVIIGIHRVGKSGTPSIIQDVLFNGLKLTGHLDGATPDCRTLSNNISFYTDNKIIIDELMYAETYKNSPGSYIIRIPEYDLEQGKVYIIDQNGAPRLDPKYILGYVPVNDKHIEGIITKATIYNSMPKEELPPQYQEVISESNTLRM